MKSTIHHVNTMNFIIYLRYHPAAWENYHIETKEESLAGK